MLSEYVGVPCTAVEAQSSESLLTSEDIDGAAAAESHDAGVRVVQSFSTDNSTADSAGAFRSDTPVSSVSTTESPAPAAVPATPQSKPSEPSGNALSSAAAEQKEKVSDAAEVDSSPTVQAVNSPSAMSENAVDKPPAMSFNFEQEVQVNQKDIMDMYMKSMQQFTDSLAKMKLPLDIMDNGSDKSGSGSGGAATSPSDSSEIGRAHV